MKLFEIRKKRTATQEKPDVKLDQDFFKEPEFHAPEQAKEKSVVEPKTAGADTTRTKVADVEMPPEAGEHLANLTASGMEDEIDDDEASRRAGHAHRQHVHGASTKDVDSSDVSVLELPKTPENLPAIVNKQIAKKQPVEPEWHMVKNLPGYLQNPIRAMGRAVFKVFTRTPIENINVMANVNETGPNSPHEMNSVAHWILHHGHQMKDVNMDFAASIPGYDADVKVYHALGYTFMIVKDFAGHYIYSWPLADDKSLQASKRLK